MTHAITKTTRQQWQGLRREIVSASAGPELLSMVLGFHRFEEVALTRDGLLVGKRWGSDGFDTLLGPITQPMRDRTRRLWQELCAPHRAMVLARLAQQRIDPHRVGIPVSV